MAARPRPLNAPIAVLAVAVALAGCRREKKPPVHVQTLEGEGVVLPRAPRPAPGPPIVVSERTVNAAGKQRPVVLVSPSVLEPARSYPLILVLHGDGGGARSFHQAWPFEQATGANAFLAYLDGIGATWDLETTKDNRDVLYAEAAIHALASTLPIDRTRVFATGYSSGGFFSNVLACHRPGLLRAIASNAGGAPYNQREKWPNGSPKCPGQQPMAMLALHGEDDRGVTLDSGRYSAEYWAYVNGCSETEMETTGYRECRAYRGCPTGKAVSFCSIPGLGHWVWDEAAAATWTFFQRQ